MLGSLKTRGGGVRFKRPEFDSENTDLLRMLVFDSEGKVFAVIDLDVYCDNIYVHNDRLFIIDAFKAMKIYEYKMSFLEMGKQ